MTSSSANDARTAVRARSATPASSRPSSSAAISYSRFSVVPNIGGSSEFTVTVTPASRKATIGCSSSVATARVAMFDDGHTSSGMPARRQVREQRGVLRRADVPCPIRSAPSSRSASQTVSGPGRLAGVRHAVQPGRAGGVEVRLELRPRYADLGAAEAEADQGVGAVVERVVEGRVGGGQAALAGDVVDPAQHQPEVALGGDPRVLDRLGVRLDRHRPRSTEVYGVQVSSAYRRFWPVISRATS